MRRGHGLAGSFLGGLVAFGLRGLRLGEGETGAALEEPDRPLGALVGGDGGVDVVAISGKTGVLIQCKSSSVDGRELGWEAVKDVVAGAAAYRERYSGVRFTLAAVTNRRFNGTARGQAVINGVELIDGDGLAELMQEKPVRRSELAAWLFAGDGA